MKKTGNYRHGYNKTPTHRTWLSMKRRCDNPNAANYYLYGGRGIKYEPRWAKFENFLADMGEKPNANLSLDRINNSEGYSKDNCRWATAIEQASNKRNSRYIEFQGQTKTLSEWGRVTGLGTGTLFARLNVQNWPTERALTEGAFVGKNQTYLKEQ